MIIVVVNSHNYDCIILFTTYEILMKNVGTQYIQLPYIGGNTSTYLP